MKTLLLITAALVVISCSPTPDVAVREQQAQRAVQDHMVATTPLPQLQYSAERVNLIKRAERLNTENVNGCVTLLSYGRVIAQYNVAGKVSSLNAYLTGDQRVVYTHGSYWSMESPDVDGTYGANVDGIFFFEANTDAYVEWRGDFLYSDQCLTPNERPAMSRIVP